MLVGFQFCCSLCHVFWLSDLLNWCCFLIHSMPLLFFSSELPCSWILDLPKVSILSNHRTKRSERFEEFGQKCSRHRLMTITCQSSRYLCYSILKYFQRPVKHMAWPGNRGDSVPFDCIDLDHVAYFILTNSAGLHFICGIDEGEPNHQPWIKSKL